MGNRMRTSAISVLAAMLAVAPAVATSGVATATNTAGETQSAAAETAVLDLGWSPIGGPYIAAAPEVKPPGDLLFEIGFDGAVYVYVRESGVWTDPIPLGGLFTSVVTPAILLTGSPQPFDEAFGVGIDGAMWYGTGAGGWQSLGGAFIFDPTAVTYQGVTYVFGIGIDNAVWYRSLTSGWFTLGGFLDSTLSATTDGTNLYLSGVGIDGALWSTQLSPSLTWSPWQSHGGQVASYPVSAFAGGTGYVFGAGADDAVWYLSVAGGQWSGWQSLGGISLSPPAPQRIPKAASTCSSSARTWRCTPDG